MKTSAKQFTVYGNIGLVQVKAEPETSFLFRPGAPELKNGGLIISEATGEGVVSKLRAINKTEFFLLLTDADVLTGAKQNRILNKSVLLSPLSETIIDVSCIERLRWTYTDKNFSSPGSVADPDLRKEKAASVAFRLTSPDKPLQDTQRTVWSHVNRKLREKSIEDKTESYSNYIKFSMEVSAPHFPSCEPENGCNGIAVVLGKKVVSIDIFGNEEVYRHYFAGLRDSAFRIAQTGKKITQVDIHEAYYKVLDTIDNFMSARRISEPEYTGAGSFNVVESSRVMGFDLSIEGQLIHNVVFVK